MKILVVDDDRDMVDLLTYWLRSYGYTITQAYDGEQAIMRWRAEQPDLVILDIEMPKLDGFEVCRRMSAESNALVLFLTCRDREADEVRGLYLGGDDYLRKPFSPKQLLAHLRALIRRGKPSSGASLHQTDSGISVGALRLDPTRHEIERDGMKARLTPTESRLLHLLMTHSGQVLTASVIVERVWGYSDISDTNLIKTHIRHLRQKVEPIPAAPRYIVTIPGAGYTFVAPDHADGHEGGATLDMAGWMVSQCQDAPPFDSKLERQA